MIFLSILHAGKILWFVDDTVLSFMFSSPFLHYFARSVLDDCVIPHGLLSVDYVFEELPALTMQLLG